MNAPARTTSLEALRNPPPSEASLPAVSVGFGNLQSFELTQRVAKMFASSTLVPVQYRAWVPSKANKDHFEENPAALANCSIALNMAARLGADPLMVMQNLHIIEGRPGWSAVWIIASINQCGRFEPLRYDMTAWSDPRDIEIEYTEWEGPYGKRTKVTKKKTLKVRDRICIAWTVPKGAQFPKGVNTLAKAREAGMSVFESTPVSIELAIKEGWYQRNGSKWQTMPDQMMVYRSAAFFGRVYAPELLLGLPSSDELEDMRTFQAARNEQGTFTVDLEEIRPPAAGAVGNDEGNGDPEGDQPRVTGETIDAETGEVTREGAADQQQPTDDDRAAFEDAIKFVQAGKYDDARAICPAAKAKSLEAMIERREQEKKQPAEEAQPQARTQRRTGNRVNVGD